MIAGAAAAAAASCMQASPLRRSGGSASTKDAINPLLQRQPQPAVFVPIGSDCSAAAVLKRLGLRAAAFPFDWCVVGMEPLLACVEADFDGYTSSFAQCSASRVANAYGIQFPHDFPGLATPRPRDPEGNVSEGPLAADWAASMPDAIAKYERRIARWRHVCSSSSSSSSVAADADHHAATAAWDVVFVRHCNSVTRVQARAFVRAVASRYPRLRFLLMIGRRTPWAVAVQTTADAEGSAGVIAAAAAEADACIHVVQVDNVWGNVQCWTTAMQQLGLLAAPGTDALV
jgi:hypothetical protein